MLFLILGTSKCPYCQKAKKLLDNHQKDTSYIYVNLLLEYGDEWRSIFNDLKTLINGQKSIPLVFQLKGGKATRGWSKEVRELSTSELVQPEILSKYFDFQGGYTELESKINAFFATPLELDDDY